MTCLFLFAHSEVKLEPVSALTDISITSDCIQGFKEVVEGQQLTHTITVRDEDMMQCQYLRKGSWVADAAKLYPAEDLNLAANMKSGKPSYMPMSNGPGILIRKYTVTASAGEGYWKQNPNTTYRDVVDEFVPQDGADGKNKDTISKNNRVQILVRIKKPSK